MEDAVTEREAEKMAALPIDRKKGEEEEEEERKENHVEEVKGEEKKEGGFMKTIISNWVSPSPTGEQTSPRNGVEDGDGEGDGGLINNLISKFRREHDSEEREPVVKRLKTAGGVEQEEEEQVKDEKVSDSDGGRPIFPDDATPSSDEAAILIHSIVHD